MFLYLPNAEPPTKNKVKRKSYVFLSNFNYMLKWFIQYFLLFIEYINVFSNLKANEWFAAKFVNFCSFKDEAARLNT